MTHLRTAFSASLIAMLVAACYGIKNQAAASFSDGNLLYSRCISLNDQDIQSCMSYIVAISDAISDYKLIDFGEIDKDKLRKSYYFISCQPQNRTVGQITDVVTSWLKNNPQFRHHTASSLVAMALAEAFPCKN